MSVLCASIVCGYYDWVFNNVIYLCDNSVAYVYLFLRAKTSIIVFIIACFSICSVNLCPINSNFFYFLCTWFVVYLSVVDDFVFILILLCKLHSSASMCISYCLLFYTGIPLPMYRFDGIIVYMHFILQL